MKALLIASLVAVLLSVAVPPGRVNARGKSANQILEACLLALYWEAAKNHAGDQGYLNRGIKYCQLLADEIDRQTGGK